MKLCGHRGFAGSSACIAEHGHTGAHRYGNFAAASFAEDVKDAERYRWLLARAKQKAAHDLRGKGCVWTISLFCDDSNRSFDTAVDVLIAGTTLAEWDKS